jgi:predicted trehalose synthase
MAHTRSPRSPGSAKLRAVPAAPATATNANTRAAKADSWTRDKQAAFLRALSATHSVTEAAQSVGMSRQSAYRLRSRLKGQPFDLAWEVAFHHSYDVLAHTALERALNGVEVPVFFQGEQVGAYRRFDERLTVALLSRFTMGGNPAFGRLGSMAERHARDFEALLGKVERGEAVATGALGPDDPGEFDGLIGGNTAPFPCPSALSDDELMDILQKDGGYDAG